MKIRFPGEHLERLNGDLKLGGVNLRDIAKKFGTPLYVYDFGRIRHLASSVACELRHVTANSRAFFAVKSLGNLSVLKLIHDQGLGMDVVSGGEIERCIAAGIPASSIIFSGVAKSRSEIDLGIRLGINCFNIESPHEVDLLLELSRNSGREVNVALRVNPDVDGHTHKKINTGPADTKFGLSPGLAKSLARKILDSDSVMLRGLSCHIGSQILDLDSFSAAAREIKEFARDLMGIGVQLKHIDMGGGVGVAYRPEDMGKVPAFKDWVAICEKARPLAEMDLFLEPGRSIVGDSGVLLTEILDIKNGDKKNFVLVDAGMTELVRPAMYDAYHHIEPVSRQSESDRQRYEVVGPVCETSCWLGEGCELGLVQIGDILAVMTAGAYGMSMASNYNSRPRPAEVAIEHQTVKIIKNREALSSLWDDERIHLKS